MSGFLMLLTHAALAASAAGQCSKKWHNCWDTQCCEDPKALCHAKKEGYALCLRNCTKGVHKGEPKNDSYWECNVLAKCAWGQESGENCMIKGCCQEPGKTCFAKVDGYGQCREECPKGWNCTKVTAPRPYLAFACNDEFEQCGGDGFKKNPCCKGDLVCYGDQPEYYQQCTNKHEIKESDDPSAADDDDDDDSGMVRLAALPTGLLKNQEPRAGFPGSSILGAGLLLVAGAAAIAAKKGACRCAARQPDLCAEDEAAQRELFAADGL